MSGSAVMHDGSARHTRRARCKLNAFRNITNQSGGADFNNWAADETETEEPTGFSGAYATLSTFFLRCKEKGLQDARYEQLLKAVRVLSHREGIAVEDEHFDNDTNTVSVLASAGIMSVKQVAAAQKKIEPIEIVAKEFMTQDEVLEIFKERIMEDGQIMHKKEPAMIRPAVKGERVVTMVEGRVTSDVTVQDDSSVVVKAPTTHQEEYVLNGAKFQGNWKAEGGDPVETAIYTNPAELAAQGFKLHHPRLVLKWTYEIQEEDLEGLPSHTLKTEWGALQTIISGDYLALPYPETAGTEIYIIPNAVVVGVYQEYDHSRSQKSEHKKDSVCSFVPGGGPDEDVWATVRMLKVIEFDRKTRGDIMNDTQTILHAFQEPYNLLFRYQMDEQVLAKWIQDLAGQYNEVEYHSWTHAFDVFQFIYLALTTGGADQYFHFQDILALLLGALSHDVGHMGTTNNFLIGTQAELAIRYNDKSPLESMHASTFFKTLQKPGLNFLSEMSPENFGNFRVKVIDSILATDMCHHFELIDKLSVRVVQAKAQDMPIVTKKDDDVQNCEGDLKMLLQAFMHMSDLGHCVRPFDIHKHTVVLLEEEFFKQGDQERELGMTISPMMDRRKDSAATSQTFFLSKLVQPLISPWTFFLEPELGSVALHHLDKNREEWEALVAKYIPAGEIKTAKAIVAMSG